MSDTRLKALVLDDEEDLTFLLSQVLEFHHFDVKSSNRPTEAIRLLGVEAFDLFITDFKMDEMDGFEVIRQARAMPGREEMKIVLLTFREFSEPELRNISRENVTYLKKPFLPNELVQKIESLFS